MTTIPMTEYYIQKSLELNLFWIRIIKEHFIFMQANLMCQDVPYIQQTEEFKSQFEGFLHETICLANGLIGSEVLLSGELLTDKTLSAERKTVELTGIKIGIPITVEECNLTPGTLPMPGLSPELAANISSLNERIITCACSVAEFMEKVYQDVIHCRLYTTKLPSIYAHQRRETLNYIKLLRRLQNHQRLDPQFIIVEEEMFWNYNMMVHAEAMRQLLDFSEQAMIKKANDFAQRFHNLVSKFRDDAKPPVGLKQITSESRRATVAIRDFKATSTDRILECQLKGVMSALLTDHLLRETNYYLRILNAKV
ncbi:DUF2935 domain-containing protein [Desulfitobacterium sp.]|uniref:DUF2935 domain-containing protein n=1 Tax=Desulfitobacterium sp. TaxID=49981 RepID=UPI002B200C45|nr:DUF2935 domain-containing protein [Desulfitobacterium sp.]MEA4902631.1 DUF2935 domain-containing protein [Desulfitobacterium sp.]